MLCTVGPVLSRAVSPTIVAFHIAHLLKTQNKVTKHFSLGFWSLPVPAAVPLVITATQQDNIGGKDDLHSVMRVNVWHRLSGRHVLLTLLFFITANQMAREICGALNALVNLSAQVHPQLLKEHNFGAETWQRAAAILRHTWMCIRVLRNLDTDAPKKYIWLITQCVIHEWNAFIKCTVSQLRPPGTKTAERSTTSNTNSKYGPPPNQKSEWCYSYIHTGVYLYFSISISKLSSNQDVI